MGVLLWDYPASEEEGQRGQVISGIVQSAIKLFLHQRNQIPLPLEQLRRPNILSKLDETNNRAHRSQQKELKMEELSKQIDSMEETDKPRQRIQQMVGFCMNQIFLKNLEIFECVDCISFFNLQILNRKRLMKETKGRSKDVRASRREEVAFKIITNLLQVCCCYIAVWCCFFNFAWYVWSYHDDLNLSVFEHVYYQLGG